MKRTRTAVQWPCIFSTNLLHSSDELVDNQWKTAFGGKTPFGDLRNQWRQQHCRTLNPYGSDTCPYETRECVRAWVDAIRIVVRADPSSPVGYFRRVAKSTAAKRADSKPRIQRGLTSHIAYGNLPRTGVPDEEPKAEGSGVPGPTNEGLTTRPEPMRGTEAGPLSIGEVLRQINLRPREDAPTDGQESTE